MINFIPNDPLVVDAVPMRRVTARPERAAGTAGIALASNTSEGTFDPGSPDFVVWQARQASILAIEAWEEVLGQPLASWAQDAVNPALLMLIPDAGEEVNAYYDRESLSFFHANNGHGVTFTGASTDVVAHEVGHGVLDALRPDLWFVNLLEVGSFHEAFGDITSIVTALRDKPTREALLSVSPDLSKPNFVEAITEDLADTARRLFGANFSAAKPRRALNTFKWQLPQTMPQSGGPDVMIAEVHSLGRIITGCFYDILRGIFTSGSRQNQAALWKATKTAAALVYEGARTAPAVPRFFRAFGRAMVLADNTLHGGAHGQLIGQAFFSHGIALGAQAFLAPELALAGGSPTRSGDEVSLERATISDLRRRVGAGARSAASVSLVEMGGTTMANVSIHDEVPLDKVDKRLRGVVAGVDAVALVGESGGSAALMTAPRAGATSSEVLDFVGSLVNHNQLDFGAATAEKRGAKKPESSAGTTTHAVRKRGRKKELRRVRFSCGFSGGISDR
ncbi:hypothetical protein [Mycolicibacterium sp. XJ870]